MRTLRNPITHSYSYLCIFLSLIYLASCSAAEQGREKTTDNESQTPQAVNAYFPLAVGNQWEYECSVEGEYAFDKKLTIDNIEKTSGATYYRGTLVVSSDPLPLVTYYTIDPDGTVYSSLDKSKEAETFVITANPKHGETIHNYFVEEEKDIELPNFGHAAAVLIENFDFDDPNLSESQRMNWQGKFYTREIGLVIEADGLGGECVIKSFITKK